MISDVYRNDIQGLRALCVLSITLFHASFVLLPGAFLGVDIFFVISGFLITGNILREREAGTFSFLSFFNRRLRRLMPAAVTVVVLTLIVGYFILSSQDYRAASKAGIASILSVSNILFWREAGYFDAANYTKPFLHYWSLSVEEQFYLIWPFLLVLAARLGGRKLVMAGVVAGFVLSLLSVELFAYDRSPTASFFLTPFRAFEFMCGAFIAVGKFEIRSRIGKDIATLVGLTAIVGSMILLTEHDRMPGFLSLFSLFGCALVLASPGARIGGVLRFRPMVLIGNASYSIYLVHWPVIAFYMYTVSTEPSLVAQFVLLFLTIALGFLVYVLVETPLRKREFWTPLGRAAPVAGLGSLAAGLVLCAAIWMMDGLPSRFQHAVSFEFDRAAMLQKMMDVRDSENAAPIEAGQPGFYLIGDSMSRDAAVMMSALRPDAKIEHFWISAQCQGLVLDRPALADKINFGLTRPQLESCQKLEARAFAPRELKKYDVIILASRWQAWSPDYFAPTIAKIRQATNAPIIVFGNGPAFSQDVATILERNRKAVASGMLKGKDVVTDLGLEKSTQDKAESLGVAFLDKTKLLCPDNVCTVMQPEQFVEPYYIDYAHISVSGAKFWAEKIRACDDTACRLLAEHAAKVAKTE